MADAYATGGGAGAVNAQASLAANSTTTLEAIANLPVFNSGGQLHAEAFVNAAHTPRQIAAANGANAVAFITGDPTNFYVNQVLGPSGSGGPLVVAADFNIGGANPSGPTSQVFALGALGAFSGGTSATALDYHSEIDFATTATISSPQDLIVGLVGSTYTGSGTLIFQIINVGTGTTLLDQGFGNLGAAATYFTDTPLDFGPLNSQMGSNGLSLKFTLDMFASTAGASFSGNLIFGNSTAGSATAAELQASSLLAPRAVATPEPKTLALLAVGALGLLARRRAVARSPACG
ncbi:MAG: PEP-CTERM sorting domain-containing protein [Phycisphaerae bacterium]|nr:PEP-CTERM sorting domain-containing protein [Phycisphaerae bacterium]